MCVKRQKKREKKHDKPESVSLSAYASSKRWWCVVVLCKNCQKIDKCVSVLDFEFTLNEQHNYCHSICFAGYLLFFNFFWFFVFKFCFILFRFHLRWIRISAGLLLTITRYTIKYYVDYVAHIDVNRKSLDSIYAPKLGGFSYDFFFGWNSRTWYDRIQQRHALHTSQHFSFLERVSHQIYLCEIVKKSFIN